MDNCPEEMEFFNSFIEKGLFDKLNNVLNNEFGRITYTEAIEILEKSGKKFFSCKYSSLFSKIFI